MEYINSHIQSYTKCFFQYYILILDSDYKWLLGVFLSHNEAVHGTESVRFSHRWKVQHCSWLPVSHVRECGGDSL